MFAKKLIHASSSESDDSEDESMQQLQIPLMEKMGVVEGALLELTHQYQLGIKV